jgi:hypothetical protein
MTAAHTPENNGARLAYNEMTVGQNGSVMRRDEKARFRDRLGYCKECEGVPTLLFKIKKNMFNPLWVTKEPRAVAGECAGGFCFSCHPNRDPNRRARRYGRLSTQTGGDAPSSPVPRGRTSAMQRGREQLSMRGIPMRAECLITEASMETMATTTMTTAESQPFSSSRSSCSLRAPDDDAAAATASQSPSRPTRFTPPLAPGRKRTNFLNCSVPEPRRGSSADLEETTSARGDTSRCTRADSSLSQMSGSSLDSHHLGSCSEESKTEIGLDEVRDHSSENHARHSS